MCIISVAEYVAKYSNSKIFRNTSAVINYGLNRNNYRSFIPSGIKSTAKEVSALFQKLTKDSQVQSFHYASIPVIPCLMYN